MHANDRIININGDTVLLQMARSLAREDQEDWYIILYKEELHVSKLMVAGCLRFVRVVEDDGTPLRFPSIRDAQEFLRNELSVSRTAVYLEDVDWESEEADFFARTPRRMG